MTSTNNCVAHLTFEDVLLGEPTLVKLNCNEASRLFPYYLRQKIHDIKRVPPFEQTITKISALKYSVKIRQRDPSQLMPLTIHGHNMDEYHIQMDKNDTVLDIKYILSPLVNNGPNAQDIQLNFNTIRRLNDDEIMYQTNCLSPSIRIMFWFEMENTSTNALQGNETPIYQSVAKLLDINPLYPDIGSTIRRTCDTFKDDNIDTFGYREYIDKNDLSKRGAYSYINYGIISQRIDNISVAFKHILHLDKSSMIGLCSINRREWLLCDYASALSCIVTVPLYPTLDGNALSYITNHAKLNVIVTDCSTLKDIVQILPKCRSLRYIVLMDDELPDLIYKNSAQGQQILNKYQKQIIILSDLETRARKGIDSGRFVVKDEIPNPHDLYTIMYTSGTTGNPKGVMLTHHNIMSVLNSFLTINAEEIHPLPQGADRVHLSYLPLAHIMERAINLMQLIRGVKIGFWRGDVNGLIEDMNVIKPPMFIGVPRIFQRIQDMVINKMNASNFIIKWLYHYAYNKKLRAILNREESSAIWDKLIFKKINDAFGGNIVFVGSGSAPLSKELAEFLKVCLASIVGEGYGLTETCAGGTGTHEFDLKYGHVGQPRCNIQLKLVSVPEMNYLVSDEANPRGEIWMRGPSVFKGYYKNKEKTDQVLRKDGWFQTGDIGEWRAEGRLQIIDRKKNIFKLSQGEYIRPEYIQNVYKLSRYIANIFVYGNSFENYLVAIIVPDFEALQQHPMITESDLKGDLNKNEKVFDLLRSDMKIQENNAKLNGFEKVKKFKLIREEFSAENGLLTISMKLKRNAARKKFEKELKELYHKQSKL